jgi:hypothetical protein
MALEASRPVRGRIGRSGGLTGAKREESSQRGLLPRCESYLLQPFFVSSKPSNSRDALTPASVSMRCGCPFSTV